MVLNTGPLDWESRALTTRPLLNEHDYFIHCTIFCQFIALRETKSISNIAHVLSRVSNVIDINNKKENKTNNTIKLGLCFMFGVTLNNTQI